MNEWLDEWMDEGLIETMNGWMSEWTNEWVNERLYWWMTERLNDWGKMNDLPKIDYINAFFHVLTICKSTLTKARISITNTTAIGKFPDECCVLYKWSTKDIESTRICGHSHNINIISIYTKRCYEWDIIWDRKSNQQIN